ncbi:hypothetical protein EV183_003518 [Coemansia sp. RSA 2336]|nr:hypothetical protein EV183_003518 [Coemansia sp. RSA 2336]
MRFITVASLAAAAVSVAASPYAAPNYGGNIAQIIGSPVHVPVPPVVGYPVPAYPGGGAGSGSNGNGSNGSNGNGSNGNGSNGSGSNGSGSNGSGSNGSGSDGSGSNGSGSNGQVGDASNCGLKPGQKAALTPLVEELKLTRTVDDLKHLTKQITDLLGDTLQEDATSSILKTVDSLVAGLGLGGLDLKPAVDSVTSILRKQVPCLLDTLLPKP